VGLEIVSAIFNNFLHGIDSNIVIEGSAAGLAEVINVLIVAGGCLNDFR
jgi:hypothetical protein